MQFVQSNRIILTILACIFSLLAFASRVYSGPQVDIDPSTQQLSSQYSAAEDLPQQQTKPNASAAMAKRKSVLFISSYHPGFPSFFSQVEGLKTELEENYIQLDIEFMDSKRFPDEENIQSFFARLSTKLKRLPRYDAVVVGDDNATRSVMERHSDLFPNTPVVFLGVNNEELVDELQMNPWFTGIAESASMRATLSLIQQLYPNSTLLTITDHSASGLADEKRLYRYLKALKIPYKALRLDEMNFEELFASLEKEEEGNPILLIAAFIDMEDTSLDFYTALQRILASAHGPVFHLWEHGMGQGLAGGKIVSHFHQGQYAGEQVSQILNGRPIKEIPIEYQATNKWIFDYAVLKQHKINVKELPENSIFLNEPTNTISRYVLFLALIVLVLVVATLGQLIVLQGRKKEEERVRQQNQMLELVVSKRTHELEAAKNEVEKTLKARDIVLDNSIVAIVLVTKNEIQWCNQYCEYLFGYTEEELQGLNISRLLHQEGGFEKISQSVMDQIKSSGIYVEEVKFKRNSGESFWGLVNAKSVSDETFSEGILFIVSDISKLKTVQFELELLNEKLIHISQTDELTQVANRRSINENLLREHSRLERYQQQYCVILLDIDHFKLINDNYGHTKGDEVLQKIAMLLKTELRSVDEVGRWGGEEFMVICPFTNIEQAMHIAETLRTKIKNDIKVMDQSITASFGVFEPLEKNSTKAVLDKVDEALYKAKENRDCVINANSLDT